MFNKLLLAVIAAALLFIGYLMLTSYYPQLIGNESFYPNIGNATMPDIAPPTEQYPLVEPPRIIVPGGPSTPNARVPTPPAEIEPPEVKAQDPYHNSNGSSFVQDNLRHPERMFSPGIKPVNTSIAVESGVMSNINQSAAQALQVFSPETAQNGGIFMNGVSANDTLQDSEYSAF
jgi:hypothetical protein